MSLPYFVEYLLTLRRRGSNSPLLYAGTSQTRILAVPPGVTLNFSSTPLASNYAMILYATGFGPRMVPGAFDAWAQQWGSRQYAARVTEMFTAWFSPFDTFIVITQGQPAVAQLTNVTPLFQYFETYGYYLLITSEDDYEEVLDALRHTGSSDRMEHLADEAVNLLAKMSGTVRT